MAIAFVKVSIGGYTFVRNPRVEDISNTLLQDTERSIDGTMTVSYIPQSGDDTKIKRKRSFRLSGIDPNIDQIEAIEAVLETAGPLAFTDTIGNTYNVHVTEGLSQSISADSYVVREYSFSVEEE